MKWHIAEEIVIEVEAETLITNGESLKEHIRFTVIRENGKLKVADIE